MIVEHKAHSKFLVVLVGSNPLPNYLAACALRPICVALVYTEETKDAKDRLRRELARALGDDVTFDEPFVEDATCATTVRRALDSLVSSNGDRDVLLNYTGGTKVMAAHARLAFLAGDGRKTPPTSTRATSTVRRGCASTTGTQSLSPTTSSTR